MLEASICAYLVFFNKVYSHYIFASLRSDQLSFGLYGMLFSMRFHGVLQAGAIRNGVFCAVWLAKGIIRVKISHLVIFFKMYRIFKTFYEFTKSSGC